MNEGGRKMVNGFSIIEVVIAISIMAMASVAPLTLSQKGVRSSYYARDQVTAFYLAQEAVEFVRYIRDSNSLGGLSQSSSWLNGLSNCVSPNICGINVVAASGAWTFLCSSDPADCLLTYNPTTGIYGKERDGSGVLIVPAVNTDFKRKVTIVQSALGSDPYGTADITVTVSWSTGRINQNLVVKEKIFNWYPAP